ncbi:uncharacterized protein LOC131675224 [Phymastichus coffea]|uniref:uncharacterized protein LOC131675224 n=1 Tax=Phymastichus coffea TaxID=108790 RepID=UPI00273C25EE|nr:uncharacterized protein LOC131675224 [Phymastichus coffea]
MIDGKVCGVLNNTSSQTCFICKTTISHLNDIETLINMEVDPESLSYGFSILHAHIRFMELVLHISYRLVLEENATWRSVLSVISYDQHHAEREQNKPSSCSLRDELGILVDIVLQGAGNTNDGNTARKFFKNFKIVSNLTGFDEDLLQRFHVILVVISSGYKINTEEFQNYCEDTAKMYVTLYNFYYMPPSVHVILLHGWKIMDRLILPIGYFSEEALENERDAQNRIAFCQFLLNEIYADPGFMDRILWTDESTYVRKGMFNQHNEHQWAHENPHVAREGL